MKVHDKYVIEIGEIVCGYKNDPEAPANVSEPLARIKGFNALVFDQNGLGKLKKVDEEFCIQFLRDSGWLQRHDKAISGPWRRWEKLDIDRNVFVCPRCGRAFSHISNFCSFCGLDMIHDEEQK